jgi:pimeloyl-ACP methyl ester carboxylesterase
MNTNVAFAGTKYRVNGIDMHVVIQGQGPDVLLVHGFPDSSAVWRHQIPALVAAGYRVIAPDLRGFGESTAPPNTADYKIDRLVSDLIGILDVLEVRKVRLVGHDWGSAICWHTCLRHPDRIDRYVALAVGHPSAYAHGGILQTLKSYYILFFQLRGLSEWTVTRADWWLWRRMMRYDPEFPTWKRELSRPGRLTAALNYYRANLDLVLPKPWPKVTMPVMGVWGEGDVATAERQMIESEKYVASSWRYERIGDQAGHWLMLSAPEKFNALLLDYLKQALREEKKAK